MFQCGEHRNPLQNKELGICHTDATGDPGNESQFLFLVHEHNANVLFLDLFTSIDFPAPILPGIPIAFSRSGHGFQEVGHA